MTIETYVNQVYPIRCQLNGTGAESAYVTATLRDEADTLIEVINMTHVADGFYSAQFVPTKPVFFSIVFKAWLDEDHTEPSNFQMASEQVRVMPKPVHAGFPYPPTWGGFGSGR